MKDKECQINQKHSFIYLVLPIVNSEMMSFGKPTMQIEVLCNKSMVDKLLKEHAANFTKIPGFGINVALISNLKEVVDFSFKDSEGDVQKGKKLVGDCKEILLAPQGIGVIRKNIQDLNL